MASADCGDTDSAISSFMNVRETPHLKVEMWGTRILRVVRTRASMRLA